VYHIFRRVVIVELFVAALLMTVEAQLLAQGPSIEYALGVWSACCFFMAGYLSRPDDGSIAH